MSLTETKFTLEQIMCYIMCQCRTEMLSVASRRCSGICLSSGPLTEKLQSVGNVGGIRKGVGSKWFQCYRKVLSYTLLVNMLNSWGGRVQHFERRTPVKVSRPLYLLLIKWCYFLLSVTVYSVWLYFCACVNWLWICGVTHCYALIVDAGKSTIGGHIM